jgi:hypothetical protein
VALRNREPARLRLRDLGRLVVLEPLRFAGPGVEGVVEGRRQGRQGSASLRLQLGLGPLGALAGRWIKEAAGTLEVMLRAEGDLRAPALAGEVAVREPVRVWPAALLVPVEVTGGRIGFEGPSVEVQRLALNIATVGLQVDGAARVDAADAGKSTLDLRVSGAADGAALARRIPRLIEQAHGRATLAGRLGGTVASPTFDGSANFAGFGLTTPGAPVVLRSLDGRIDARGKTLTIPGLTAALGPAGKLQIGSPEAPATVVVASVDPPAVASLSARVRGQDIATLGPIAGLRVQDLDLELGVDHQRGGPLRVSGDVWIGDATLLPTQMRPPPRAPKLRATSAKVARELFPEIALDVGVHSPDGALEVVVPYLPDIDVTLDCRVVGSLRRPSVSGRARGDGFYSRLAVFLFDLFTDAHVRRCGAK